MKKLFRNLVGYFIPQYHPRTLRVGLSDKCKPLPESLFGDLEGETEDMPDGVDD